MGGGGLVGQRVRLPPQFPLGVHGDVVHGRLPGDKIPGGDGGGVGNQVRRSVVGKIVVGGHPSRQPPLVAVNRLGPKGDVIEQVTGRFTGGQVHIVSHDFPIQGDKHVAENIGSIHRDTSL